MAKETWKPGNMLYPLPAVLVTVADNSGNENVFMTVIRISESTHILAS